MMQREIEATLAAPAATTNLGEIVARLSASADALAALGAALDSRNSGVALDRSLQPHIDGVLAALGIGDAVARTPIAELQPMLARLRCYTLTNSKLLFAGTRSGGAGDVWADMEPAILEAAGDATAGFASQLKSRIAPQMAGLSERLGARDAAFLDIGVGVAALSIGMARQWPTLRIVGVDPAPRAIAIARERIRKAGFDDRIEVREQPAEMLTEHDAFDLAWLPSVFIPEQAMPAVVARARDALRPGGWLLVPTMKPGADDLSAALARLRTALFGGFVTTADTIGRLLTDSNFIDVQTLPAPATAITSLVVGRRQS